jgi:hypothetical protein
MVMPASSDLVPPTAETVVRPEQREFYRLNFPYAERPRLVIGTRDYEVVDCSVRGVRYVSSPKSPILLPGDRVEGTLRFRRRTQTPIQGLIMRIQNDQIALFIPDSEIPFTTLWGEERWLLAHYPMWKR